MKKIALTIFFAAITFTVGGCPFMVSSAHSRAHQRAIHNDMVEIHHFLDRHFWNYDWEDPYAH